MKKEVNPGGKGERTIEELLAEGGELLYNKLGFRSGHLRDRWEKGGRC